MITTPSSFTLEHLSSLKFKELQKLSSQYQVNKRWAKKQELIDNLLALKEKNEEENQWTDGSVIVSDLKPNKETEVNKRLTFNVDKENKESHLTFDMPQNGKNLLNEVNPRETYDIPPNMSILGIENIIDPRATFDIPFKEKLLDVDPRATFDIPQTASLLKDQIITDKNINKSGKNNKLNCEARQENANADLVQGLKKLTFDISFKNREEKNEKSKSEIKTLTIPYVRVPKRTKKEGISKNNSTPIKMSTRSINIKKSTKLPISRNNLIRSPAVSSAKKVDNKQNVKSLTIPQDMNSGQRQIISRFEPVEGATKLIHKTKNMDDSYKENMKTISQKRHSKAENFLNEKLSSNKVNFATPPPKSGPKASRVLPLKKTPLRKENEKKRGVLRPNTNITQTPCETTIIDYHKGSTSNVKKKLITATKMPDFSKIHKRQFEQMDSLHDYIKKKEERIRKLFGTPQPGQQLQALNKSESVFQFKSSEIQKGSGGALTFSRKKENTIAQKEALKKKLPPSKLRTDVKDKNRSHIHGVRTNKRFELQMKFRNM